MKKCLLFGVALALLVAFLALLPERGLVAAPDAGEIAPGSVLVKFKQIAGAQSEHMAAMGATVAETLPGEVKVLRVAPGTELATVEKLRQMPEVALAAPNYIRHLAAIPNDTYYAERQWNMPLVDAPPAWDRPQNAGPIVGIIDTGLDAAHPEFSGRVLPGDGRVTDSSGTCGHQISPADDHGHGTLIAGIIGAAGNNNQGIAGLSWTSRLLPFKAASRNTNLCSTDWLYGLNWLLDHGARVINMSFGGASRSEIEQDAINDAWQRGALLVAAAGNTGSNTLEYPASYDNVISVGAVDVNRLRSSFSAYNSAVDIVAPGGGNVDYGTDEYFVFSTYLTQFGSYRGDIGTSLATPHVTGAAALLLAARPDLTNAELRDALLGTAADLGNPGRDDQYGDGLLDVAAALNYARQIRCAFADVCPADYYYQPVRYLVAQGAISGYGDGAFRPFANTTRSQLCKILVLGSGWGIDTSGGPHFADVTPANAFYNYVETAYNRGVVSGYADGAFRPFSDVTRGQLAKIVVAAQGWPADTSGGPHFADVTPANTYYAAIETAYHHGIISGYADGSFKWSGPATRGQIAKIVWQALGTP